MNDAEVRQEPEPPPGGRRRTLRRTGFGALGVVFILAVLVGAVAWQATRGAVSLEPVRSNIEAALAQRLPAGSSVTIGSAAFAYRSGEGVIVKARDIRLALPGAAIAVEELTTGATPGAILRRRIDLSSVTASGVEIDIPLAGGTPLAGSAAEALRQGAERFAARIGETDAALRAAGLDQVAVHDAVLRIFDGAGQPGPALAIADATWLPLGDDHSKARLQVAENAGSGWGATVEQRRNKRGEPSIDVKIEDLPLAALAPKLADADGGVHVQAALTLQAHLATDGDGTLSTLQGALSAGSGSVSLNENDRVEIAGASIAFALEESGDRLVIRDGNFRTRTGGVAFEGAVDLGEPDGAVLVGNIRSGALPAAAGAGSIELTGGEFLGRLDFSDFGMQVERLHLTTAEGSVSAIGQGSLAGSSPGLSLALSFSEMPVGVARAFWPPFVASKTRRWLDANVRSGMVGPAALRVALPPDFIGEGGRGRVLPEYALLGTLPFHDARFFPLSTLPPIEEAAGEIAFANATAMLRAVSGIISVAGKGELQAGGTTLTIPELGRPQLRGNLRLALSGPASALAALSDMKPLSIAAKRGIRAAELSGDAALFLDANIPLYPSPLDDVKPSFRLALTGFTSASPIADRLIEDADLVLEGTPESFTVKGAGRLDGMEASVDLTLGSEAVGQRAVQLSLDDAARERLGLGLGGLVTGPVAAAIQTRETGAQAVSLDLGQARIQLPFLGWEKGAGVAATGGFVMEKSDEGTRITDLHLSGKGFAASGSLLIGPEGRLQELNLTELALRPGDSVSVTATAGEGGYDVRISGSALDARGIIRGLRGGLGGSELDAGPLRIGLDIGSVTGQEGALLSNFAGSLALGAGGLQTASLAGKTEGDRPFEWTLGRERGSRTLKLSAEDGGALMRFAGIYGKIAGGRLTLDYSGAVAGAGQGVLHLSDFRMINEAALEPAVRSARPGLREAGLADGEASASGDLHFTQLRVPFRQEDWVLSIDEAALRGPMLGATASGTINIRGGRVALSGTFIPAFGINNIAGAIPLIGTILGGGRDEGLVGITYKLFGPLDDPELTMNPVSAIAPGIFRRIFEYN